MKYVISITNIADVKTLNEICCSYNEEVDIQSGKYVIDAKSVMGIFSLSLLSPLTLTFNSSDEETIAQFEKDIKKYIIN